MKKTVEILAVSEERVYTKKDGTSGYGRSIVVQWLDEGANGRYEQSTVVELNGRIDVAKMAAAIKERRQIEVAIYFSHSEFDGKFYPRMRGYLPADYMIL